MDEYRGEWIPAPKTDRTQDFCVYPEHTFTPWYPQDSHSHWRKCNNCPKVEYREVSR